MYICKLTVRSEIALKFEDGGGEIDYYFNPDLRKIFITLKESSPGD